MGNTPIGPSNNSSVNKATGPASANAANNSSRVAEVAGVGAKALGLASASFGLFSAMKEFMDA